MARRAARAGVPAAEAGAVNLPPRTAKLPHGRPEAVLGRDMLRALGSIPDVAMYNNESGRGYTGSLARAQIGRAHV